MSHFRPCTLCLVVFLAANAVAQTPGGVRITSGQDVDTRIPIAVPPATMDDPTLAAAAQEMTSVIVDDLAFSGLFRILPRTNYPAGFVALDPDATRVDMDQWREKQVEHLVYGKVMREGTQLVCQFRLFDLLAKEQVIGKQIAGSTDRVRLMAHTFSEEIIRFLDGIPGIGTTEICFSGGESGKKELYISDYDGANLRQLTQFGSISINPQVSPDGTKIAFMSYKDRYPYLYILDRASGNVTPLSKEVGLNSAPDWAPDGKTLALTLSKDGNSEIYLRNVDGSNPRRLTKNTHNDTSPTFSPNGQYIAWVADIGSPQIYMMNADGTGARRISYQGGNSYDPSWSPDGKYIAYAVEKRGEGLEIYVCNWDGSNARRMTNSQGSNEAPSWSPDSRHIVFTSTRTGTAQLWFVTLETGLEQPMAGAGMRREGPSWGPRRR